MKRLAGFLLLSCLLSGCWSACAAQGKSEERHGPPKVLVIMREFLKPGKQGSTHEKTESAFVQAFRKANWPQHYFSVDSLSGKPRSLFLVGYNSFADWEKDNQAVAKNAALSAALERASAADGELLSEYDTGVFTYREDYSLNPPADIAQMRYFEISLFHVRPGHRNDWDELVKLVMKAYEKIPDTHWVTFEANYGTDGGTYLVFNPIKSLSEVDKAMGQDKDFAAAMGPDGMKRLAELEAASVETSQTNLFMFNPRNSYPPDEWIKADPAFWKPSGASSAAGTTSSKKKTPAKE